MTFKSGPANPKWKGGKCLNEHGYVKITAGPDRHEYEHRAIIKKLWRIHPGGELPLTMEVEHVDKNRTHNCPCNLLVLDERIHHYISIGPWSRSIRKDEHARAKRRAKR